jgi:DNA invertase Pin-like site-specific DNA recombinase
VSNQRRHTAIYIRVSTDNGTQSTDSQLDEVNRFCQSKEWLNTVIYEDKASGTKASRPALDKLVKAMREGAVERVVVYKLCRLGRSLTHLSILLNEFKSLRVPLIATSQGLDTSDSNPCGQLIMGVLMCVADWERQNLLERCAAGIKSAKNRGVIFGRKPTLHKRREEVMNLKQQGLGMREISRQLNIPISSVCKIAKLTSN